MKNTGLIILMLVVVFALGWFMHTPTELPPQQIIKVDTIINHDTSYVPKITLKTKYNTIYRDTGSIRYIPVDTAQIVAAYMKANYYIDTLINDTNANIVLFDTVRYNRIVYRRKQITIYPHTKMITLQPRPSLYLGVGIGGNYNKFGIAGKMLYTDRRQRGYELSINPIQKYYEISVFFKLRFRKNHP